METRKDLQVARANVPLAGRIVVVDDRHALGGVFFRLQAQPGADASAEPRDLLRQRDNAAILGGRNQNRLDGAGAFGLIEAGGDAIGRQPLIAALPLPGGLPRRVERENRDIQPREQGGVLGLLQRDVHAEQRARVLREQGGGFMHGPAEDRVDGKPALFQFGDDPVHRGGVEEADDAGIKGEGDAGAFAGLIPGFEFRAVGK